MEEALIGLVGILVGILLNEYFRKRNRIEQYSLKVFEKRLEIYETLMNKIDECWSITMGALLSNDFSKDEKNDACFSVGHGLMVFLDENQLYMNEEIIVHIGATLAGVSDLLEIKDRQALEAKTNEFLKESGNIKRMIKSESGLDELNNLFGAITKAKHSSPIIAYFREQKRKQA